MPLPSRALIHAKRIGPILHPDRSRVLLRPFRPTTEAIARRITTQVMSLPEAEIGTQLEVVMRKFERRHHGVADFLERRYRQVKHLVDPRRRPSARRRALIGAYFTHEYSPESAALFNPSIVPHPDQAGMPHGSLRFILSLRATGEGHISSITFRVGEVSARDRVTLVPAVDFATEPERVPNVTYDRPLFTRKLEELGSLDATARRILAQLPDHFTLDDLRLQLPAEGPVSVTLDPRTERSARAMLLLAESNYEVRFAAGFPVSQRVLFPSTPSQSNGIEDARFVEFREDDGTRTYFATYTAYDGRMILPQLLATPDFLHFKFITLNGPAVQNKGMALFPRRIAGRYAMLSRQDDENILIMFSDNLHFWAEPRILLAPEEPWEFVKLGNCGSPIETERGWLVLSHGVGAMRTYCLGAFLLDRDDPTRVLGRLRVPLLSPNESEREGYVPNVVYTCGSLLHGRTLIIPYAMSDSATSFASVSLDRLLDALQ